MVGKIIERRAASVLLPVLLLLFGGWAAWNWSVTVHQLFRTYLVIPDWDSWDMVLHLPLFKSFDPHFLWIQHNEHRIPFPESIFALDFLAFHGRQVLPLVVSFLCYAGCWMVMGYAVSSGLHPQKYAWLAFLLSGVMLGWRGSTPVLYNAFLLQWPMSELAAMASFVFLAWAAIEKRFVPLLGSMIAGVIATYSSGNGLLIWPILIVAALLLRMSKPQLAIVLASGALADGLYFVDYRFSHDTNFRLLFEHPAYAWSFAASYLSMPFGAMKSPGFGVLVGSLNMALAIFLAIIAFRRRILSTLPGVILFGTYAFTLSTALITAAGRMNPEDPYFIAAKAARYLVSPIVNWGAMICLLLWISRAASWKIFTPPVLAVFIAALLGISFIKLQRWINGADYLVIGKQIAELALEDGISDASLSRNIFPDPNVLQTRLALLRGSHLSIYYRGGAGRWLGLPAASIAADLHKIEPGAVTSIRPVVSGYKVTGWADVVEQGRPSPIFIVDEEGKIAGIGRRPRDGLSAAFVSDVTPSSLAWIAFIPTNRAPQEFSVMILDRKQRGLVKLPGIYRLPDYASVDEHDVGVALSGIAWQMDPSWTRNGGYLNQTLPTFRGAEVYGSWSGSDANVGKINSSDFRVPSNACVVIPVSHGPRVDGLSAKLLDTTTGRVIWEAPMEDGDDGWNYWRVSIPKEVPKVRLTGDDEGVSSGEWMAFATPAECVNR